LLERRSVSGEIAEKSKPAVPVRASSDRRYSKVRHYTTGRHCRPSSC